MTIFSLRPDKVGLSEYSPYSECHIEQRRRSPDTSEIFELNVVDAKVNCLQFLYSAYITGLKLHGKQFGS